MNNKAELQNNKQAKMFEECRNLEDEIMKNFDGVEYE